MEKIRTLTLFTIITASLIVGQMGQTASAGPIFKQVTLEDLGILQLAAHDLFLVDRVLEIDFENGLLDLSTLFTDVKTGLEFSDEAIGMGGEQRNRENIMLFTVASELGQMYLDLKDSDGPEVARQQTIEAYHLMLADAYFNTFDEPIPSSMTGCVTMTENLALRTVHDLLPGNIIVNEVMTPVLDPSLHGMTLSDTDMAQLSANLDGLFDPEFLNIHIIIPPDIDIIINLFELDSTFAFQFDTDFTFEHFMSEVDDGFYNHDEDVMNQIRNLFAKGLGDGCLVGGETIPIETTSLILACAQSFSWMIPVVLSIVGIGLVFFRRDHKN